MNNATIRIGSQDLWRVAVRRIRPSRGIGVARIAIDLEVRPVNEAAVGTPMWLSADLNVRSPETSGSYLCRVASDIQPTVVGSLTQDSLTTLHGNIDLRQLQVIEQARGRNVELELEFYGSAVIDNRHVPFWAVQLTHDVVQSNWTDYLGAWGYKNVLLFEIEQSGTSRNGRTPAARQASDYLMQSQTQFLQHHYRPAVESLRQCLTVLAGETELTETTEAEVASALKTAGKSSRNGSDPVNLLGRFDLVRLALKFTADVAAHPETDDITRPDAEMVFTMAAALVKRLA